MYVEFLGAAAISRAGNIRGPRSFFASLVPAAFREGGVDGDVAQAIAGLAYAHFLELLITDLVPGVTGPALREIDDGGVSVVGALCFQHDVEFIVVGRSDPFVVFRGEENIVNLKSRRILKTQNFSGGFQPNMTAIVQKYSIQSLADKPLR